MPIRHMVLYVNNILLFQSRKLYFSNLRISREFLNFIFNIVDFPHTSSRNIVNWFYSRLFII